MSHESIRENDPHELEVQEVQYELLDVEDDKYYKGNSICFFFILFVKIIIAF